MACIKSAWTNIANDSTMAMRLSTDKVSQLRPAGAAGRTKQLCPPVAQKYPPLPPAPAAPHQPLGAQPRTRRRCQPPAALPFPFQWQGQPTASKAQGDASLAHPQFQLPLAIALAGAAFEAYLEPTGAEGFQEHSLNGTDITYTDSEFLSDVCEGVLQLELQSASGLRVADITGASDPYAVLSVGASTAKSKVINATLNPVWNESFLLYVRDLASDILKVRLYDKDFLTSDDDLGTAMVALSTLTPGQEKQLTLELKGPGGQGTVTVKARLLRFSDHLLDRLTSDGMAIPQTGGPSDPAAEAIIEQGLATAAMTNQVGSFTEQVFSAVEKMVPPQVMQQLQQEQKQQQAVGQAGSSSTGPGDEPSPWRVLAHMAGWQPGSVWTPVAYINNENTDTQVWLYRSTANKEAVVAFRGTEQVKWKDLATDLNLVPAGLDPERSDPGGVGPLRILSAVVPTDQVMVHSGFLAAYDSVKPQVFRLLDEITRDGNKPWTVYVTGHSLGGALATLCAYELAARQPPPGRPRPSISMYSFGAPRVGNKVFASKYDRLVRDSWRVTNSKDIIPSVPRLLGYGHVRHSVRLKEGGGLEIQPDDDRDVFGEGRGGLEVIQELVGKAMEQNQWEEVYEEIKAAEMALLDNLVTGAALEEHMENFYLDTLKAAVLASAGNVAAEAATVAAAVTASKQEQRK